jgi:hypothetical protein
MSLLYPKYAQLKLGVPTSPKPTDCLFIDVPEELRDHFPKRIYVGRCIATPLANALAAIASRRLHDLIETWDGCYNVRKARKNSLDWSLHSWGVAVDFNQVNNPQGIIPDIKVRINKKLVECFTDNGFEWGGDWHLPSTDCMHFQLSKETFDKQYERFYEVK